MQPIIYDVAVSIDGFIAGPSGDTSRFPAGGPAVDDYLERLTSYSCVIMGRATYEAGYDFGLQPGVNPYPHMACVVFSRSLVLPKGAEIEVVRDDPGARIEDLRKACDGPLYLCGGGQIAGWLLAQGLIDRLRLKRAPIFLGSGTALFGDLAPALDTRLRESKLHADGVLYQEFNLTG